MAENKILHGPAKNLRGPAVGNHCVSTRLIMQQGPEKILTLLILAGPSYQLLSGFYHQATFYIKDSDISCILVVYFYFGVDVRYK